MKKKIFALAIALIMVAIVTLVGCDFASDGNDSGDSGKKPTTSSASAKNITVTVKEVEPSDPVEEEPTDIKSVLKRVEKTIVKVNYKTEKATLTASGIVIGSGETKLTDDEVSAGVTPEKTSYVLTSLDFIEKSIATDKLDAADNLGTSDKNPVSITTYDGKTYPALFVGGDPDSDVCVLYAVAELPACTVYNGKAATGESVIAGGNPLSAVPGVTFTSGIVSAVCENFETEQGKITFLQTDAFVKSGSAGGGLFTRAGYLVGLITERYNKFLNKETDGIGIVVPSDIAIDVSKKLMETFTQEGSSGYIPGKFMLGYSVKDYSNNVFGTQGYVYFDWLDETGSLYKCGIVAGDKIISVRKGETGEEYKVTRASGFKAYIESLDLKIGDRLVINIERNTTKLAVTVTVLQYVYGRL